MNYTIRQLTSALAVLTWLCIPAAFHAKSLPSVQKYTVLKGDRVFNRSQAKRLVLIKNGRETGEEVQKVVRLLQAEFAEKTAKSLPALISSRFKLQAGDIAFELSRPTKNDEAYKIKIRDRLRISAGSPKGLLYAGRTVLHYFLSEGELPYGAITDESQTAERAIHIDIARKFYPKDWIIDRIKEASWLKLNTVQLHFSENEGFRIESKTHPEVMSDEYISQDELKEILQAARDYHVEIIPSLDSPGHLRQALKTHPEWRLPSKNGQLDSALNITNAQARAFIKELYSEYMDLFSESRYFHIGGDEFIDFSKFDDYPVLADYARTTLGIQNGQGIDTYIDFVNEIASFVEQRGFIPRVWNDGFFRLDQKEYKPLKDGVEITYWTRWDPNMAPIDTFLAQKRHIINFNDSYFYYVLGENAGYIYPRGERIYNEWYPGNTASSDFTTAPAEIIGSSFAIWSDRPQAQTAAEVAAGIRMPLRAMAERIWRNTNTPSTIPYADFVHFCDAIGDAPTGAAVNKAPLSGEAS